MRGTIWRSCASPWRRLLDERWALLAKLRCVRNSVVNRIRNPSLEHGLLLSPDTLAGDWRSGSGAAIAGGAQLELDPKVANLDYGKAWATRKLPGAVGFGLTSNKKV